MINFYSARQHSLLPQAL